jgi:uncharacterized protein YeeX (DUF496 family)
MDRMIQTLHKHITRNQKEVLTSGALLDYQRDNQKQTGTVSSLITMMKSTSRILRTLNKNQIPNGRRKIKQMLVLQGQAGAAFPANVGTVRFQNLKQRRQAKRVSKCLETHVRGPMGEIAVPMQDIRKPKGRASFRKNGYPELHRQLRWHIEIFPTNEIQESVKGRMPTEVMIAMIPKELFPRASIEDEGMMILILTNLAGAVRLDFLRGTLVHDHSRRMY